MPAEFSVDHSAQEREDADESSRPAVNPLDVVELARQIAMRMDPDSLLNSADVGAMLKCGAQYVTEEYAKAPGFPKAYRLTRTKGKSQPRWKRGEIQAWIDSHKNGASKRGGRPRKMAD